MRRRLSRLRIARRATLALLATTLAACSLATTAAEWRTWELGGFVLRTPASMHLTAGGIDSQAGVLTADGLRIDYDFGLYSDPLVRRDDMRDYQSTAGTVDGLAARFVRFRLAGATQSLPLCSGVHVPQVRRSGTGILALTVLACADRAERLTDAPAIFESIRFQDTAGRS